MCDYKLRCSLVGHTSDVRALAATIYPENGILSGSRDVSARVWNPSRDSNRFTESACLRGHNNFVSAVSVSPPDDTHPHGLIYTASNDSNILVYSLDSLEPLYKIIGHSSTVCSLSVGKLGVLVSGSWDKTAKIWFKDKCVMTLQGHEAAVWAVATVPGNNVILTGSADKTIKLWLAGKVKETFTGHSDCVRALCVLSSTEFLSCSNDATIRHWRIGQQSPILATYYGHSNYIYGLTILSNGQDFASCGEDRMLKIWEQGNCVQTIPHPVESVWCVCCLENGDIVTGASDGIIRVFTRDTGRMADEDELLAYDECVKSSSIPTQIGDVNVEDLPGPDSLAVPGKRDGQSKMVKEGDLVNLYNWDSSKSQWVKVGEVVGGTGGNQRTFGKKLYEGQEYDYVFDVDIEEGAPPLKLPYNTSEDPWFAAQRFLHKNDLSQLYLDQVANFIQQNSRAVTLGAMSSEYKDPFTGDSRYVPDQSVNGPNPVTQNQISGSQQYPGSSVASESNEYFPQTEYVTFVSANVDNIIGKLKEFNKDNEIRLDESMLDETRVLIEGSDITQDHLDLLNQLLQWPLEKLFPVLDVLRIALHNEVVSKNICLEGQTFINRMLQFVTSEPVIPNGLLSLRIMTNLFKQSTGERLMVTHYKSVLPVVESSIRAGSNKNLQIASSSLLLNYAVVSKSKGSNDLKSQCVNILLTFLNCASLDNEAAFRILISIGTLMDGDTETTAVIRSLEIRHRVNGFINSDHRKLSECAQLLLTKL